MLQDNFIPGMGNFKHVRKFPQQKLQNSITTFCDSLQMKQKAINEQNCLVLRSYNRVISNNDSEFAPKKFCSQYAFLRVQILTGCNSWSSLSLS